MTNPSKNPPNPSSITIEELHGKFQHLKPSELILDVRTPQEYAEGHVPGSRNIPYDSVPNHATELARYERVYIYCKAGGRVAAACGALQSLGLTNFAGVLRGGMPDWEAAGFETEKL